MAKKAVATLRTGVGKQFTKCIKMVKSEKTGAYIFKEAKAFSFVEKFSCKLPTSHQGP